MRHATASSSPACFEPGIDAESTWQAWFDGAALPNPEKIGVGIVLLVPDGQRKEKSVLPNCSGCNNEAELHALSAALEMVAAAGARCLLLQGDSDVALSYVRRPDQTQVVRLRLLVAAACGWLRRFDEVQLLWIPRHRNREADRLSRLALGLPQSPASLARERRRALSRFMAGFRYDRQALHIPPGDTVPGIAGDIKESLLGNTDQHRRRRGR